MDIESNKKCAFLDNYQLVKTLGQGYHAKVKLGFNSDDQKYYAIKIFKKTHDFSKNRETLTKEFKIMENLNHPNLINLISVKPEATYKKKNGETYQTMAIVLEYAGAGELFEYVSNCGRFSEEVARTYFQQMLGGLEYLHKQGICHRDMKPENLLYDDNFLLKIADFGFATALQGKDGDGLLRTILGTESYMCPEIHQKIKYEGNAADLFASAIILFILITGHPPFMKADPKDPYYKLLTAGKHATFWKAHSKNKPGKDQFFSPEIQNLFNTMFAYQPGSRATLEEVKSHTWFNGPTKSMDAIKNEFLQRQQIVNSELERARLEKIRQKQLQQQQQQQQNLVFTGVGKFRSGEEIKNEFQGLEQKYPTVNNKRTCKSYNEKLGKRSDFFTVIDPEYLLKTLLNKDNEFCKEIKLSDDGFKLKCMNIDSNGQETKFNIEFLKKDEDVICVDFTKVEGCAIDFFNILQSIKQIINSIGQQDQQQEKVQGGEQQQAQQITA